MLTAEQARTVAYQTDDGIVCPDCLEPAEANSALTEVHREICSYSAVEMAEPDGLHCDRCGTEIVGPPPKYGTEIVGPPPKYYRVTLRIEAPHGVSADDLERIIENTVCALDEVTRVYSIGVDED